MNEIEVDPDTTLSQFVENYIQKPKENPEEDQLRGDYSALKLIPNFLSSEECDFFSGLVSSNSKHRIQQLSNRKRLIFDSEITASWFWERMKPFNPFQHVLDEHGDQWIATGINPRFRLIRYDTGDQFRTHEDGFYWESWNKKTFATAMVYLNTMLKKDGGSTRFHHIHTVVEPAKGLLVLFLVNNLDHCGEQCGTEKYLLRTDVFYELNTGYRSNSNLSETLDEFEKRRKEIYEEFRRYSD